MSAPRMSPAECVSRCSIANRVVRRAHLEPRQVVGDRRLQVEQLDGEQRAVNVLPIEPSSKSVSSSIAPLPQLGPADLSRRTASSPSGRHGDRHPRKPAALEEVAQPVQPVVGGERHARWTIVFLVIDCDIHPQVGDVEEFLGYVDPAQREWFRGAGPVARDTRLLLGAPVVLVPGGHRAERTPAGVRRGHGAPRAPRSERHRDRDPERGRRGARLAHAEPVPRGRARPGPQRVAPRAVARRGAAPPRVDPLPGPGPAGGRGRDPAHGRGRALRPGASLRGRRPALRRAALPADLRGRRRVRASRSPSIPAAREWGSPRLPAAPARSPSTSNGTPSDRPAASCPTSSRFSAMAPSSACRA